MNRNPDCNPAPVPAPRYPDGMTPFADESARCRAAQVPWSRLSVRDRLRPVREFRHLLVEHADELTAAVLADVRRPPDEVVGTDLLPVAAACKFLLAEAERILRPKKVGGRPLWLFGTRDTVHRRPYGVVGLIGTWNYPVYLTAIPVLQALVAGNGVLWKPSELTPRTAEVLHDLFLRAGFPADLVVRLPATREAGPQLAEADVDFVHFTGSDRVGRKLAARLGERLIPSALELSGVDAVVVLPDADVRLAARSAWFGATLNAGQTCLAARRILVHRDVYEGFVAELRPLVEASGPARLVTPGQVEQAARLVKDAEAKGATVLSPSPRWGEGLGVRGEAQRAVEGPTPHPRPLSPAGRGEEEVHPAAVLSPTADLALCREASFAPLMAVTPFDDTPHAVSMHNACPFGLGAAVFTRDADAGRALAARAARRRGGGQRRDRADGAPGDAVRRPRRERLGRHPGGRGAARPDRAAGGHGPQGVVPAARRRRALARPGGRRRDAGAAAAHPRADARRTLAGLEQMVAGCVGAE